MNSKGRRGNRRRRRNVTRGARVITEKEVDQVHMIGEKGHIRTIEAILRTVGTQLGKNTSPVGEKELIEVTDLTGHKTPEEGATGMMKKEAMRADLINKIDTLPEKIKRDLTRRTTLIIARKIKPREMNVGVIRKKIIAAKIEETEIGIGIGTETVIDLVQEGRREEDAMGIEVDRSHHSNLWK